MVWQACLELATCLWCDARFEGANSERLGLDVDPFASFCSCSHRRAHCQMHASWRHCNSRTIHHCLTREEGCFLRLGNRGLRPVSWGAPSCYRWDPWPKDGQRRSCFKVNTWPTDNLRHVGCRLIPNSVSQRNNAVSQAFEAQVYANRRAVDLELTLRSVISLGLERKSLERARCPLRQHQHIHHLMHAGIILTLFLSLCQGMLRLETDKLASIRDWLDDVCVLDFLERQTIKLKRFSVHRHSGPQIVVSMRRACVPIAALFVLRCDRRFWRCLVVWLLVVMWFQCPGLLSKANQVLWPFGDGSTSCCSITKLMSAVAVWVQSIFNTTVPISSSKVFRKSCDGKNNFPRTWVI